MRKRQILVRVHAVAGRVNNGRRDKDHEVALKGPGGLAPEEPTGEGQVSQNRHLVLNARNVLRDEAAQDDGLAVPDDRAGDDLAQAKCRKRLHCREGAADAEAYGLRLRDEDRRGFLVVTEKLLYGMMVIWTV